MLDLGCAAGSPTTKRLVERFAATGVDISRRSVELVRRNVPDAGFIRADMTALELPPERFDAVAAFYSITHVPREDHAGLLRNVAELPRPGGLLVAAMGAGDVEGSVEEVWLGAPTYFSHYDAATNQRLVEGAGLRISRARAETEEENGEPVTLLWIVARKPH